MSVVKLNERGLLIIMSGPSGVGKDTICNELLKTHDNLWASISMTTRPIRDGEKEGVNYFYVTKEEFEKNIKEANFLEYAIVHSGQYYGTPKEKIEEKLNKGIDVILNIDIQGALKIKEEISEALFIFLVPPTMDILKQRLIDRNTETAEKVVERFKTAYKEINELAKYNYVVVNDTVEQATNKVSAILLAEKCRVDRIEQVELHNTEELIHESLID